MSQGNINQLLELWDHSLAKYGGSGPFVSYKHIYNTIDAIEQYFTLPHQSDRTRSDSE